MTKAFFSKITLVIFLTLSFLIPHSALADGMLVRVMDNGLWDYSNEKDQYALINHKNGIQKMIIGIGYEPENSKMVWLFPVPTNPKKIKVDIIKEVPQIKWGSETKSTAKRNLQKAGLAIRSTQFYPYFIEDFFKSRLLTASSEYTTGALGMTKGTTQFAQNVIVHKQITKEGVTSEVITAKTANGLYQYLKNKGLNIEKNSIPVLNEYIGKNYSFIASWISNPTKEKTVQGKGTFVTFPTKDIYFPLLPTSVYKDRTVPATIQIIGHVTPKLFNNIEDHTQVNYLTSGYFRANEAPKSFYTKDEKYLKYTQIRINAPSKLLSEDLWIKKKCR